MTKTILIADDHQEITDMLSAYLLQNDMVPIVAHDGLETLEKWKKNNVSLILLDIMMPHMDGYTVLKKIRETSTIPVIMLTAKGEEGDKLMGLEFGADDYIVKPFSPKEVIARINAVLRRVIIASPSSSDAHEECISYEDLTINMTTYEVTLGTLPLNLTKKEIDMLYILATHTNQVFSRDELLDLVWGYDYYGDIRTVDTHIKRLRAKLQLPDTHPWQIKTIWGVGYKFETTKENS
ncbi:MAG: response regulator transcription factor [Cellulosilyticaceae bacterium]